MDVVGFDFQTHHRLFPQPKKNLHVQPPVLTHTGTFRQPRRASFPNPKKKTHMPNHQS